MRIRRHIFCSFLAVFPPLQRPVGFRIALFGSAPRGLHAAARVFAESTKVTFCIRGFGSFVTCTTAPFRDC